MLPYLSLSFVLVSFAASEPHAAPAFAAHAPNRTLTNEDLNRLSHVPGLISVVGPSVGQEAGNDELFYRRSPEKCLVWYAKTAASLNARLEAEQSDLRNFTQALDDVRALKSTTAGINVFAEDIGLTPDDTINILEGRVQETKSELDALEDMARRSDIPPGVLRGERQGIAAHGFNQRNNSQCDSSADGGDL